MGGLYRAGFFKELPHGKPNGPSLASARGVLKPTDRARIARYLRGGSELASTVGTKATDWFDAQKTVGPLAIRTDGEWAWPSDLPYYVETYGVEVPRDLVVRMEERDWTCRPLSDEELDHAVNTFLEG